MMDASSLKDFLLCCLVMNYFILLCWFGAFISAHDWMFRLHGRWFRISEEHFDSIHYLGMAVYKIGILLLNLVPYVALRIMSGHG